ncbi:MAG: hypothetical protein SNG27_07385 [Rikenellaceae bacterium]
MNKAPLTYEHIISLMDEEYTLHYLDYNDNLNSSTKAINESIFKQSPDPLWEQIISIYGDAERQRIDEIVVGLEIKCEEEGYSEAEIRSVFDEYTIEIRDEISTRDGDGERLIEGLLRNTPDQLVRLEMHSNYDCINSHDFEREYFYENSYFGDMVDALCLNPAKVKEEFDRAGIECKGTFPNIEERNGNEYVSYESFATEIANSVSPANLLTFIGKLNISELYEADFAVGEVTIPKGNSCGLYTPSHGGGSLLDMTLQRDFKVSLKGKSKYDFYYLTIDDGSNGCAINDVYGVVSSFFGETISLEKEKDTE